MGWNSLTSHGPVRWPGIDLRWRHNAVPALTSLHGQVVQKIELLEWRGNDAAQGMAAIGFVFPHSRVTVFNALDENGLSFTAHEPGYVPHPLR